MESVFASVLGSIASSVVSGIFSSTPDVADVPTPPAPELPKAMPTPDNAAMQADRERKIAMQQRTGLNRASTILTQGKNEDKAPLGG